MNIAPAQIDLFVRGYMVCALWASTDESTPSGGYPMDDNYGIDDIDEKSKQAMRDDCLDFIAGNEQDIVAYMEERGKPADWAGHDFWLTRCGHGAGFWDRGLGWLGDRLSEAARIYGDAYLYVGDDGRIHYQ